MSKDRVFTQDEVNEIVKKRLERERNKQQDVKKDDSVEDVDPKEQIENQEQSEVGESDTVVPEGAEENDSGEDQAIDPNEELKAEIEALKVQNERFRTEARINYAKQQMRKYMPSLFDPTDINCLNSESFIMPLVNLTSDKTIDQSLEDLSMFMSELLNHHVDRIREKGSFYGAEQEQISMVFRRRGEN